MSRPGPAPRRKKPVRKPQLVLVGNGMAGVGCLEQILTEAPDLEITVFGEETYLNYSRILLPSVLARECSSDELTLNPLSWYLEHRIALRLGIRITDIDLQRHTVTGDDGSVTHWDQLLLATGSTPFRPPIEGIDKPGVAVFRSAADLQNLIHWARPSKRAVVIGGGLLGLETAYGLRSRGCDVTVLHRSEVLMNRQLDAAAAHYVRQRFEGAGIGIRTGVVVTSIEGEDAVEAVRLIGGECIPADFVVVTAGVRPNATLACNAGLEVGRGIVVNDRMETSHPNVFAVGECVEHRGQCHGFIAPLLEQGRILAATIAGKTPAPPRSAPALARLKTNGIDAVSCGEFNENQPGLKAIKYEDAELGIYKKLVLRGDQLAGFILVGDLADHGRYTEWLREGTALADRRRSLLSPEPAQDPGAVIARMADGEVICGCLGITKGAMIECIHTHGISTLSELRERSRASAGCGSCGAHCKALLEAVSPGFKDDGKRVICGCLPFSEEQIREIIQSQRLRSVQQVLEIYGNGTGCEVCKPALSYLVDVIWCGHHEEDRSTRFINERVHANIQKDGTFSVVPRIRGGVTSPRELRRIAEVAERYKVRMVKITGGQRIDLLGVRKEDLPSIWAELGMPSGQAYAKAVRTVKTCVGTEFCRYGTQDAITTGIELERRLENLFTPHKTKLAVSGCPRNCAEATVKDIGLVGQEGSWQMVVGGAAGKTVRKADVLVTVETTAEALEACELFFQFYRENANYLERTYDFVERMGMDQIRRGTVYAPLEVRQALLTRLARSKTISRDAWLERKAHRTPHQFVQIQPMERPVNA